MCQRELTMHKYPRKQKLYCHLPPISQGTQVKKKQYRLGTAGEVRTNILVH